MYYRICFVSLFLLIITACASAPKYDINLVARISGEKNRLGQPIKAAKCSFIQAQTGESEGLMRDGLCVAFNSAFVFRSVDINDSSNGNSIVFHHSIINGAGISPPSIIGVKQLVLSTNVSSNGFIFRHDEGLGYDNSMTFEFMGILRAKNVRELKEPKSLNAETSGGTTYIFINNVNKKK